MKPLIYYRRFKDNKNLRWTLGIGSMIRSLLMVLGWTHIGEPSSLVKENLNEIVLMWSDYDIKYIFVSWKFDNQPYFVHFKLESKPLFLKSHCFNRVEYLCPFVQRKWTIWFTDIYRNRVFIKAICWILGFEHSAFIFGYESMIADTKVCDEECEPGALISLLRKALQFTELEAHVRDVFSFASW